ncbi:MAG: VanZ family protein [Solirubrobacterales bacterium]
MPRNRMDAARITAILGLLALLAAAFGFTWYFSSQNIVESNASSLRITTVIMRFAAAHFTINPGDTFWYVTLNQMIRTLAHFSEYAFVGMALGALLYVLVRRLWLAALLSTALAPFMAYIDEYHQQFSAGRSPQWFDVYIDWCGAVLGIFLVLLLLAVYRRIQSLKARIRALESPQKTE